MAQWADALGGLTSVSPNITAPRMDIYQPDTDGGGYGRCNARLFFIAALIVPFHDPLRLAEDIRPRQLSKGESTSWPPAYAGEEFPMFDVPMRERAADDRGLKALRAAFTGEPFDFGADRASYAGALPAGRSEDLYGRRE